MPNIKDRRQIYPEYSKQKVNLCAKNIGRDKREHNGIVSSEDEEDYSRMWKGSE